MRRVSESVKGLKPDKKSENIEKIIILSGFRASSSYFSPYYRTNYRPSSGKSNLDHRK